LIGRKVQSDELAADPSDSPASAYLAEVERRGRAIAERFNRDHHNWLVIWGVYTQQFIAFPLFDAPKGTILLHSNPGKLAQAMREIELTAWARSEESGYG
jgi:hypothetical protein